MKQLLLIITLGLTACTVPHSVDMKIVEPVSSVNQSGDVAVFYYGQKPNKDYKVVADLYLGDTGFSGKCGLQDAVEIAMKKCRTLGADAVIVKELKEPTKVITCHRVRFDIVEYVD